MIKTTFKLIAGSVVLIFLVLAFFSFIFYLKIPSEADLKECMVTKLYQVDLCSKNKNYVKIRDISQFIKKAIVTSEDSLFYSHQGFDFQELQKSFEKNLEKGKFVRGGSTITQQLAKNLFLSKEKTLTRKLMEAIITTRIEKHLSKNEILEKYLNVVQFGKDVFGVYNASKLYFKKHPSQLELLESVYLAFLLPSPEKYSKSYYKKALTPFAKKQMSSIISKMKASGKITEEQYLAAQEELPYFLTGAKPEKIEIDFDQVIEEEVDETVE